MMKNCKTLNIAIIEGLAKIIGDTEYGIKTSDIERYLNQVGIYEKEDDKNITKWKRLFKAFVNYQNESKCSDKILNFIATFYHPSRIISDEEKLNNQIQKINQQLAFVGYKYNSNGKFCEIKTAETVSEAKVRERNLHDKLKQRNAHYAIFYYCKAELLVNNYFHSVFEANKGLFSRIRELSGCSEDGSKLIEFVFNSITPVLIINNFESSSDINEHKGFNNMLKGLWGMFRCPEAHEAKIEWVITEQDALEILSMISYCHRRLDKSHKIR